MALNDKNIDCSNCVFFQPHDVFDYLGFCVHRNELCIITPSMKTCESFKKVSHEDLKNILSKSGWLRCLSCNKVIYTVEELKEHLDDKLGSKLFSDIVASEEAPVAG